METLKGIFKGDGEDPAENESEYFDSVLLDIRAGPEYPLVSERFPLKSSPLRKLSGPRHIAPADGTVKRVQFKPGI